MESLSGLRLAMGSPTQCTLLSWWTGVLVMAIPGPNPKITFDQYKEILKIKHEKRGQRPRGETKELTYAKLGGKFGLRPHTVVNAAKRGIKRYDIRIWKEEQKVTQSETLCEQEQPR
jgi:hypothetical protein